MDERHVFRDGRWLLRRIEAVDREQLGRPVVESCCSESPAPHTRESLSLCQIELGLFPLFDVDIDSDPVEDRSVVSSKGLRAAEEPAVVALGVTHPKTHLTGAAGPQTV